MILAKLLSRRRFVVVKKKKLFEKPREFLSLEAAQECANKLQKVGMAPQIFEVRLTWAEYFGRFLREH